MKKIILSALVLSCVLTQAQNSVYHDDFDDAIVNSSVFQNIANASISESNNRLYVNSINGNSNNQMRIVNPLNGQNFGFYNQEVTSHYGFKLFPNWNSGDSIVIDVVGQNSTLIETYILRESNNTITHIMGSEEGGDLITTAEIVTDPSDGGIRLDRKRKYKWLLPVCSGAVCDYGLGRDPDDERFIVIARWKIFGGRNRVSTGDVGSGVNATSLEISSSGNYSLSYFETSTGAKTGEDPLLSLAALNDNYNPVSGSEFILTTQVDHLKDNKIDQTYYTNVDLGLVNDIPSYNLSDRLDSVEIFVGGQMATNVEIDGNNISFTPPNTLALGEHNIKMYCYDNDNGNYLEVILNNNFTKHSSTLPPNLINQANTTAEINIPFYSPVYTGNPVEGYQFELANSQLPSGLTLSNDGIISGTPNGEAGVYGFFVRASDGLGNEKISLYFLEVFDNFDLQSANQNYKIQTQIIGNGVNSELEIFEENSNPIKVLRAYSEQENEFFIPETNIKTFNRLGITLSSLKSGLNFVLVEQPNGEIKSLKIYIP